MSDANAGGRPRARLARLLLLLLPLLDQAGAATESSPPIGELLATTGTVHVETGHAGAGAPAGASPRSGDPLRSGDWIVTGAARAALRLRTGVVVRLDLGTRLGLVDEERVELAAGAIYVDSGAAAVVRIVIDNHGALLEEVDTRFEIRLQGDGMRLRIRDGRVVLHHQRGSYEVHRGEELTLRPGPTLELAAVSPFGESWRWILEVTVAPDLDGLPLAAFLGWVSRETGLEVVFENQRMVATASARIAGDIRRLSLSEALEVVLPVFGLAHRYEGGILFLVPLRY